MKRIVSLVLVLGLLLLLPACSDESTAEPAADNATVSAADQALDDEAAGHSAASPQAGDTSPTPEEMGMQDMHSGMMLGMQDDYSDKIFLSMMIPHHSAAIAMSNDILKITEDPLIKELAEKIANDQRGEIVIMLKWLEDLGRKDEATWNEMSEEMKAMRDQTMSEDSDRNFILQMIPHHAMALEMAYPALLQSDDPKVVDLARDIIIHQAEEIRAMRNWLDAHQ